MIVRFDTKWLDCISSLDDSMRLAIIEAIFTYLEGGDPMLSTDAFHYFFMLKPFVDDVLNRQLRLSERSRVNGMKGGRKPNKAKKAKENAKSKKFTDYLQEDEFKNRCERLQALDAWKAKYVPYIYENMKPMTQKEFDQLIKRYSGEQICDTLLEIENRKDLRKRYSSLYRTLLNWMKRNYANS